MFKKILQSLLTFILITFSTIVVVSCTEIQETTGITNILNKVNQKIKEFENQEVAFSETHDNVRQKADEIIAIINNEISNFVEETGYELSDQPVKETSITFEINHNYISNSLYNSPSFTKPINNKITFTYSITIASQDKDKQWIYDKSNKTTRTTNINIKETAKSYIKIESDQNGGENEKEILVGEILTLNYEVINPIIGDNSLKVINKPDFINIVIKSEGKYGEIKNYKGSIDIEIKSTLLESTKLKFGVKNNISAEAKEISLKIIQKTKIEIYKGFFAELENKPVVATEKDFIFEEDDRTQHNFTIALFNPYTDKDENGNRLELNIINSRQISTEGIEFIKYDKKTNISYYNLPINPKKRGSSIIGFDYISGQNKQFKYRMHTVTTIVKPSPKIRELADETVNFYDKTFKKEFIVDYNLSKEELEEEPLVEVKDSSIIEAIGEPIAGQQIGTPGKGEWSIKYSQEFKIKKFGRTKVTFHYEGALPVSFNVNVDGQPSISVDNNELDLFINENESIDVLVDYPDELNSNIRVTPLTNANSFVKHELESISNSNWKINFKAEKVTIIPVEFEITYPNARNKEIIKVSVKEKPSLEFVGDDNISLNIDQTKKIEVVINNPIAEQQIDVISNNQSIVKINNINTNNSSASFEIEAISDGTTIIKVKYGSFAKQIELMVNVNKPEIIVDTTPIEIIGLQKEQIIDFKIKNYAKKSLINISEKNNIVKITRNDEKLENGILESSFTIRTIKEGSTIIELSHSTAEKQFIEVIVKNKPTISSIEDQNLLVGDKKEIDLIVSQQLEDGKFSFTSSASQEIVDISIDQTNKKLKIYAKASTNLEPITVKISYGNNKIYADEIEFKIFIYNKPVLTANYKKEMKRNSSQTITVKIDNPINNDKIGVEVIKGNDLVSITEQKSNSFVVTTKSNSGQVKLKISYPFAASIEIEIFIDPPKIVWDTSEKWIKKESEVELKEEFTISNPYSNLEPTVEWINDASQLLKEPNLTYDNNIKKYVVTWTIRTYTTIGFPYRLAGKLKIKYDKYDEKERKYKYDYNS